MREILFRGKTDKGEWVQGVPFFEEDRCYIIEDLFICGEYDCTGAVNSFVLPETVGQYTGLTDKNGKKIFEGDIIKIKRHLARPSGTTVFYEIYPVEYKTARWFDGDGEEIVYDSFVLDDCASLREWVESYECEIIGNIHDNPELLKGGEG